MNVKSIITAERQKQIPISNPHQHPNVLTESRVLTLCSLMLGNGAGVFIVDLSPYSGTQKTEARKFLGKQLKPKLLDHKDRDGKQIDIESLLATEQAIFIALKDVSTPKEFKVEAMHESESGYENQLKKRSDAAYAKYEGWLKRDEEKAAKEKSK